jgi:hypothetical protein
MLVGACGSGLPRRLCLLAMTRGYSDHAARSLKMPSLRGLQGRGNPVVPLDVMEISGLPRRLCFFAMTMRVCYLTS